MQTGVGTRPGRLAAHDVGRLRAAAHHATRLHPGPVGELLERELLAHAEFGHRFDDAALICRLAGEILRTAVPAGATGSSPGLGLQRAG